MVCRGAVLVFCAEMDFMVISTPAAMASNRGAGSCGGGATALVARASRVGEEFPSHTGDFTRSGAGDRRALPICPASTLSGLPAHAHLHRAALVQLVYRGGWRVANCVGHSGKDSGRGDIFRPALWRAVPRISPTHTSAGATAIRRKYAARFCVRGALQKCQCHTGNNGV